MFVLSKQKKIYNSKIIYLKKFTLRSDKKKNIESRNI